MPLPEDVVGWHLCGWQSWTQSQTPWLDAMACVSPPSLSKLYCHAPHGKRRGSFWMNANKFNNNGQTLNIQQWIKHTHTVIRLHTHPCGIWHVNGYTWVPGWSVVLGTAEDWKQNSSFKHNTTASWLASYDYNSNVIHRRTHTFLNTPVYQNSDYDACL